MSTIQVSDTSKSGIEMSVNLNKTPSYMAPTINKVQKFHDEMNPEPKDFQDGLRGNS
jgi:hypothetical protein